MSFNDLFGIEKTRVTKIISWQPAASTISDDSIEILEALKDLSNKLTTKVIKIESIHIFDTQYKITSNPINVVGTTIEKGKIIKDLQLIKDTINNWNFNNYSAKYISVIGASSIIKFMLFEYK